MKTKVKNILEGIAITLLGTAFYTDYSVWVLQHPNAPMWTYLFNNIH